jgi:WW domain-containing oxidoreductase
MAFISLFKPKGKNGFGYSSTAEEVTEGLDLSNKTYLVTGCNSGLGKESIRVLKLRGANIIGTARTKAKAETACQEVGGGIGLECELADPKSVQNCIQEIKTRKIQLDGILCNAGIMALPTLTKAFGYELQFFTNHIGHFILVTGLLEQLKEEARIVILSSSAHQAAPSGGIEFDNLKGEKYYSAWAFYGQSKFANLLFAKELHTKLKNTKQTVYAIHPGVIKTNLSRSMNPILQTLFGFIEPIFLKTIPEGTATQIYALTHPTAVQYSGMMLSDCNPMTPRKDSENPDTAKKLWEVSEKILAEI